MSGLGQLDVEKWLELTKKPPIKKIEKEKEIVYKMFAKCSEYVKDDIEWYNIFIKASIGKLKKNFKYKEEDNILYHTYYKNKEILNISDDYIEATKQIVDFIQKNDGFYSKKDKERAKNYKSKYRLTSWFDINSPILKNHLIDVFVTDFCVQKELDEDVYYPILKTFINGNIMTGNIGKENIKLYCEKISNIDVLHWNKESNYPYIIRLTKKSKRAKKNNKIVNDDTLLVPCNFNNLINPQINLRCKMKKCYEQFIGKRNKKKVNKKVVSNNNDINDTTNS